MAGRTVGATAVCILALAEAAYLPFVYTAKEVPQDAAWSAHIGDKLFFPPRASVQQLSRDASNYYYAVGSSSALTAQMKQHLVGVDGRWHIFHLPEGPSMLQVPRLGSRRSSFSAFLQLQDGQVLQGAWPEYHNNATYEHPGNARAWEKELKAIEEITPALFKDYLTQVTSLKVDGVSTRSSSSPVACNATISFLQQQFEGMGLTTCLQPFGTAGQNFANVVAYKPGSSRDTLTIGAHYDSRPFSGAAPGANDNGSGVSALLLLAKVFTGMNVKPKRDLFFVGFAAEEIGMEGSEAYVPALLGKSDTPIPKACQPPTSFLQRHQDQIHHSAIILDEVGWKSTNPEFPMATMQMESGDESNDVMNHIAQANKFFNGGGMNATHSDHPFGSDHMPFINRNLEGVLVINGDDERYPNYHKSTDTMASVDEEYASNVVKAVFGGMLRVAGLQG